MESQLPWLAGAAGLVVGIVVGLVLARARGGSAQRVHELEAELESDRAEHARYRGEVSAHFAETSRRLRDLTLQYKTVYEHLADGARRLAPEGAVELAPSLAEAALPEAAGAEPPADAAQLDLELGAQRWDDRDEADDLEPLLDEEAPAPPGEEAAPRDR